MLSRYKGEDEDRAEQDQFIVEQFTGLKDKNGREIWEGDVLNLVHSDGDIFGRGVVRWHEDGQWVHSWEEWFDGVPSGQHRPCKTFWSAYSANQDCFVEIIGNIHEHGHLLEGI
jgi:uncharacterized phage protein (TIGR01671 family)